jgi:AcrR family transcriptional regulator
VLDVDVIVEAARRIIAHEGHENFTLRRLGDELDVTAPAVYAHFRSKDELVREVAHREFGQFIEQYSQLTEADPVERLRYISRHYVQYAKENAELFRLMLTFPPGFFRRDFFDPSSTSNSFGARLFRPRAQAVGEAIASGKFANTDPFLIGLALFTAVHGVATFLLSEPALDDQFELELVDLVVDAMLRGLAPERQVPLSATRR